MKFTVIRSYRCPCEICAGQLVSPAVVEVSLTLRDAIRQVRDWNWVSAFEWPDVYSPGGWRLKPRRIMNPPGAKFGMELFPAPVFA